MHRPIVLVTGANAGLGLGVCERLLVEMSSTAPHDTGMLDHPHFSAAPSPFHASEGCTLILACRNQAKAKEAVAHLQNVLRRLSEECEAELNSSSRQEQASAASSGVDAASLLRHREHTNQRLSMPVDERTRIARALYKQSFCKGTVIEVIPLDLASLASTRACADAVAERVPYLTHLILNAGGAAWLGVDWLHATWEIFTNLHKAVTLPSYKLQRVGDLSPDGYGWVWQINAGGHYVFTKQLEPLLKASPYAVPSRIIWTGSLEANHADFHANDIQCLDKHISPHPYESTKYQCELLALGMDQRYAASSEAHMPRAYTAHPGIVATSIFSGVIPAIMMIMMKLVFYLARWTGSPHHPIDVYKGAIAASFTALAPAEYLDPTVRYGTQCTFTGHEYVHAGRLSGWTTTTPDMPDSRIMQQASDLVAAYDKILPL